MQAADAVAPYGVYDRIGRGRRIAAGREERALPRAALLRPAGQHAVLHVVSHLLFAPAVALLYGEAHRVGARVAVEDDVALGVACGASRNLGYGAHVAEETLLVGVEYGHQGHFGQVEPLAQQVHAHQHVEHSAAEVFENLNAFERVHVGVDVAVADAHAVEVFRQLLGHAFGYGGHQHLVVAFHAAVDFLDQVVYLIEGHAHFERRIDQPRGTYQLLHDHALAFHQLVVRGRGAHVDRGSLQLFELLEPQRAVVLGRGEAESVLHEVLLACAVAAEHGVHLRQGHVALVHHEQVVLGEVIQQTEGPRALGASVEVARVVLDAGTVSELLYHFEVVLHALLEALGLHRAPLFLEVRDLSPEVEAYLVHGVVYAFARGHE